MKKISLFLVVMMLMTFVAGCGSDSDNDGAKAKGNEIALVITHGGTLDDRSFNEGAWQGITKYADESNKTYKHYQPTEETVDAYIDAIDIAVESGAKVVITPGYVFEPAIYKAQDLYPDTKFILLDGTPQDGTYTDFKINDNVYSVFYAEEQSGFLAGYGAVLEGYRKLGFMGGMAVPAVVRFGYGFIQGAEYAGKELGLSDEDIEIMYTYVGNYEANPENQTLAASWYQNGTELIFACGGNLGNSVMAAAEPIGAKVVGVDTDQSEESETVITSAVKMLDVSVYQSLELYYNDEFPGGESVVLDAKVDGIGLPMENSRFEKFTQENYDNIFNVLAEDKDAIASDMVKDTDVEDVVDIPVSIVKITSIAN